MIRVIRYAETQARVRARLGRLPDAAAWRYITDAADLDNLIERMRASGLRFWLSDLPRSPDRAAIERHLPTRLAAFTRECLRLWPRDWTRTREWLRVLPDIAVLALLLKREQVELPDAAGPLARALTALPLTERAAALRATPYRALTAPGATPATRWLQSFEASLPRLRGREAAVIGRIRRLIDDHLAEVTRLRRDYRAAVAAGEAASVAGAHVAWLRRDALAMRLRALCAGDPFHAGLIFIYALLELLAFERMRGLLLLYAQHWPEENRFWEVA